jgi:hypothetical protein
VFHCILREIVGFDGSDVYSLYSPVNLLVHHLQVLAYPFVCCFVIIENHFHLLGEICNSHVCHNYSCFLFHCACQTLNLNVVLYLATH